MNSVERTRSAFARVCVSTIELYQKVFSNDTTHAIHSNGVIFCNNSTIQANVWEMFGYIFFRTPNLTQRYKRTAIIKIEPTFARNVLKIIKTNFFYQFILKELQKRMHLASFNEAQSLYFNRIKRVGTCITSMYRFVWPTESYASLCLTAECDEQFCWRWQPGKNNNAMATLT